MDVIISINGGIWSMTHNGYPWTIIDNTSNLFYKMTGSEDDSMSMKNEAHFSKTYDYYAGSSDE